jgi:hypothetical protein
MNDVETVELFSGWTSTVKAVQASLGEQPRDRLLGVSLCSEDGFCHVFMSFRTLDEVLAEIAKNAYPVVKVSLSEAYGQRYTHRQADVRWPAWIYTRA